MQIGFSIFPQTTGPRAAGAGLQDAPFQQVDPAGWTATWPSPPAIDPVNDPQVFSVIRQGFDGTGQQVTRTDSFVVTRRVRQPFPDQSSLTPATVALDDYVYATDTVAGAANASTAVSPRPVAAWVMPDRTVVGDTVTLELVAFHRNGRDMEQVACVEFRATDGVATVTQKVSASVVSPRATDQTAVIVYRCELDISSLADPAVITCNARVFPWVGDMGSVADSGPGTEARGFSPRVFRRDTARASAPPLAYVAANGSDTTGLVSTTPASAQAAPFQTVLGAIKGLKAATGVTGGRIDGCEVRIGAGTFVLTSLAAADVTGGIQDHAALRITRDPAVAKSAAILTFGLAAFRPRFPYLVISDCTIQRTGTQALTGETGAPLHVILDDVTFDNGGHNATILSSAALYANGCQLANAGSLPLAAGASEVRLLRGVTCASGAAIENWLVVGCRFTGGNHGSSLFWNGTRSSNGAITAFSYFSGYQIAYQGLQETISCAFVQNVVEYFSATSNPGFRLSADGSATSTSHAIVLHNTFAGFWNHGRTNAFYDETAGTARSHVLLASRGNIIVSVNNKGDVFMADGSRTGNWPYLYGVGVGRELIQFDSAAAAFRQEFAGLGSLVGTSTTAPINPLFTAPAHTVSGTVAGAGGGTYTLQAGSPAKGLAGSPVLRFDLAGTPRSQTAASAGAYE